ncbi:MAG TPA: hypothetical protein VHU86_09555 [Solirubrobacterales bacterium]|nr:hypothetical protein [Solirubrobacterales bacterium]
MSNLAFVALIWLTGISGGLLLYLGSKLTFFLDDWEFLVYRPGFNAHSILDPHGENIAIAPVLIYKALMGTVGMASALPYRVVSTATFLLSAILLFVLLKRRVGQWPALAATAIVLFLGAAWEDLLWPFQIGYFGSMAAGLGMLLALERGDRRGDVVACLLLSVSIVFSSLGLPFLAGAAVEVLARGDRWRRLYVVAIPLAIYAAWWLGWGHTAESPLSVHNALGTPAFVFNSLTAALASTLGLASGWLGLENHGLGWLRPLAIVALLLLAWRLYKLRGGSRWVWIALAIALGFWILAGLNQMPGRDPTSSRYQYVGAVFILLAAAELLRGVNFGRVPLLAMAVIAAFSVASNVQALHSAFAHFYHPISRLEKADLGAVEIAGDTVEPGFVLSEEIAETGFVHVEAGPYLAARDSYGSPAYTPAEIVAAPSLPRFAADKVLFWALPVSLTPVPASALPEHRADPAPAPSAGATPIPAGRCLVVPAKGAVSGLLSLPPGGAILKAGDAPITRIRMERFATGPFPIEMTETIGPHRAAELRIPADRSAVRWKIQLESSSPATVCGSAASAGPS